MTLPRTSRLVLLLVGLACPAVAGAQSAAADCSRPVAVLFVGNSRIYYHDQPAMLAEIARAQGCRVVWRMVAEGGATLASHLESGRALAALDDRPWDYVVLNTQSTWGGVYLVNGVERAVPPPAELFEQVEAFAAAIRESGAAPLLVMHPRRRAAPPSDVRTLERSFRRLANAGGAGVIPVGLAWEDPSLDRAELYDDDGNHPSPVGAFLSASVMYRTIFGAVPREPVGAVRGPAVELADGTLHADSIVELVDLTDATARRIFEAAGHARRRWLERPDTGSVGAVPTGVPTLSSPYRTLEAADLAGRWTGELKVYPRYLPWPAELSLDVSEEDGLTAAFRVSFGGRPHDITYDRLPVSLEGDYFQFVDPDGPNGGVVRYRVVPTGGGRLEGIAELITDVNVYGIGEVLLTRRQTGYGQRDRPGASDGRRPFARPGYDATSEWERPDRSDRGASEPVYRSQTR